MFSLKEVEHDCNTNSLVFTTFFITSTEVPKAFPLPIVQYGRMKAVTGLQYLHGQVNSNKHCSLFMSSHPQQMPVMRVGGDLG